MKTAARAVFPKSKLTKTAGVLKKLQQVYGRTLSGSEPGIEICLWKYTLLREETLA
jgi:hypothetical protein